MPREKIVSNPEREARDPFVTRCRVGRPGRRRIGRGRLTLILGAAVGLPCLHALDPTPPDLPMRRVVGQSGAMIRGFALSPDGFSVVMADHLGSVTLRSAARGWEVDRLFHTRGKPLAFSPDGRQLAIGGTELDVAWYDPTAAPSERSLGIPVRAASDLRFSPDGRTLAVAGHCTSDIVLWDLEHGRERMTLRGHRFPVIRVEFSPDGGALASASGSSEEQSVLVWSLATGRPLRRLARANSSFLGIAYSPDGRLLASCCANEKPVRIWDVATGREVRWIAGHARPAQALAFSPDGRLLATAAGDGFASVWSVATGRELRRLDGRADILNHVAFSRDGRILAATASDGDLRFWDVDPSIADDDGW